MAEKSLRTGLLIYRICFSMQIIGSKPNSFPRLQLRYRETGFKPLVSWSLMLFKSLCYKYLGNKNVYEPWL